MDGLVRIIFTEYLLVQSDELKTPEEWSEIRNVTILDPDGWRFTFNGLEAKDFLEPITLDEFNKRMGQSTIFFGRE